MQWDCERQGCFNQKKRLKLEIFDECFPGKIGLSDIDGAVEINGRCLMIEGKGRGVPVPDGQRIMFERLSSGGMVTVFVIECDAETMEVFSVAVFDGGKNQGAAPCDLGGLKSMMRAWSTAARRREGVSFRLRAQGVG